MVAASNGVQVPPKGGHAHLFSVREREGKMLPQTLHRGVARIFQLKGGRGPDTVSNLGYSLLVSRFCNVNIAGCLVTKGKRGLWAPQDPPHPPTPSKLRPSTFFSLSLSYTNDDSQTVNKIIRSRTKIPKIQRSA